MTTTTSLLLLLLSAGALAQSCVGRCGVNDGVSSCQCNSDCSMHGNCCDDYETICLSCKDRCGESFLPSKPCQCNSQCKSNFNCCADYQAICFSCKDRCGENYQSSKPCQCNNECGSHSNCCKDYDDLCGGGGGQEVTDDDLHAITEEMFAADVNNVYDQLTLDYQGQGSNGDLAPGPVFCTPNCSRWGLLRSSSNPTPAYRGSSSFWR